MVAIGYKLLHMYVRQNNIWKRKSQKKEEKQNCQIVASQM